MVDRPQNRKFLGFTILKGIPRNVSVKAVQASPKNKEEINMSIILTIKKKVVLYSRRKKTDHFYSMFKEGMTVLDVGFANETKRKVPDTINYFLKNYRYDYKTYTALSIEKTDGMAELYPKCRFVNYNGGIFPFKDNEFDWVFSNAVIEHVGDDINQKEFLNEMLRVAKNVYFTTPNKFFPFESHSNILFLHWNNYLFYKFCAKMKPRWSTKKLLYLFSKARLQSLLKESRAREYTIFCNRMVLITMTFSVVCRK